MPNLDHQETHILAYSHTRIIKDFLGIHGLYRQFSQSVRCSKRGDSVYKSPSLKCYPRIKLLIYSLMRKRHLVSLKHTTTICKL